jgi:biotin-(acetyl-CoA carboxylase) ligase
VRDESRPNAVTISEVTSRPFDGIGSATAAFIEHMDEHLASPFDRETVLTQWRALSVHRPGDRITCVIGDRTIIGTWSGIDEHGRALLQSGGETIAVSAGDLIMA